LIAASGRAAGVRRTLRALAVLAALLVPLAALAAPATLTIGTQLEPTGLDPTVTASSATAQVLFPAVYEGLVRLEADNRIEPSLAQSWEVSADGRVYRFRLRPGVRFHDGAPLESGAVRFSLERAVAQGAPNPLRSDLAVIDHVDTPDPLTVVVTLTAPCSRFLALLGRGAAAIVSPGSAADDAVRPVGTGPFRFVEWQRGKAIILERTPDYWGEPARIERVVYRFIADPSAALAALNAGDLDAFDAFPAPESIAALSADPRFVVHAGLSQGKAIMALNNARPPFDDLRVRRALAHAVDRRALVDGAMFGYGQPIGSHFPPQDPDYLDLTGLYPHDPARARALLAEAGHAQGLRLSLSLPPLPYARRSGEIIAAQLAEVGVEVDLVPMEWVTWLDRVFSRHDFDMTVIAHIEPMDFWIYGRDNYYFGYRGERLRPVLARLDAAGDPGRQSALLREVQTIIAEDAVNTFLFELPLFVVHTRAVSNLAHMTPVRMVDLAAARIDTGAALAPPSPAASGAALAGGLATLGLLAGWVAWRAGPRRLLARLAGVVPVLAVSSLLIFFLLYIAPGDPAQAILGMEATPDQLAALRHALGLDGSAPERYLSWIGGALRGDLGLSWTYRVPVSTLIGERLLVTVPLAGLALVLCAALALAIGVASVLSPGGWADRLLGGLSQVALAVPDFWLGMILVIVCAETLHWTNAGGFPGWQAGIGAGLGALVLPAIALAVPQAAILGRALRSELLEAMGRDFFLAARARGISRIRATLAHALPNALVPVLTLLGMQAAFLVAGSIVVETVFDLPGLGRLLFQAVAQRDLSVVQGGVLVLVAAVVAISAATDLACAALDPRWDKGRSR